MGSLSFVLFQPRQLVGTGLELRFPDLMSEEKRKTKILKHNRSLLLTTNMHARPIYFILTTKWAFLFLFYN